MGWTQTQRGGRTIKNSGYVAKESKTRIPGTWGQGVAESLCKRGNNSASIPWDDYKDS